MVIYGKPPSQLRVRVTLEGVTAETACKLLTETPVSVQLICVDDTEAFAVTLTNLPPNSDAASRELLLVVAVPSFTLDIKGTEAADKF